ncbi:MAG TPA: glutathione S-transferase family protein [Microvirga sp.]|jgi:glutathione S-transferase|nr:glutathione S-transferase family protein [Microvirga sp.]
MLTIWGRNNSINVQKVLWTCAELGLPFRRHDAGGPYGGTDTDRYRAMNPNGLVPTVEDDGFVLWESNVIVRYLATKHRAEALYPSEIRARFDVERWMEWQTTTLWPALRPVFFALVRTPPEQRDAVAVAQAAASAAQAFTLLDRHLADRAFLAGGAFTIADISNGISAYRWYALAITRPTLPNVERWFAALGERPGFREHVALPLS